VHLSIILVINQLNAQNHSVGVRPVHRRATYRCDDTRCCITQFWTPDDEYIVLEIYKVKWSRYRSGLTQRVGRGLALLFHDRGTRRGWVVSNTPWPHFTSGKDPLPILEEAGWAPGPVWTGAKNLVPTGIRSRTVQPVVSCYTDWANRPTARNM